MEKIFSSEQFRAWDAYTIMHEPIASHALMERAATKCFRWLVSNYDLGARYLIVCGHGNNGGDGLAIARMLLNAGYYVRVFIPFFEKQKLSSDALFNFTKLDSLSLFESDINCIAHFDNSLSVIVDALFGTGLKGKVDERYSTIINQINRSQAQIVSIDLPSGLTADIAAIDDFTIVKSNHTLTFQSLKPVCLLPYAHAYLGMLHVLDIGLSHAFYEHAVAQYFLLEHDDIIGILKPRNKFSHKGNFGHALLIGGMAGKAGALQLAARACMRTGVGLCTVASEKLSVLALQIAVPEVMCKIVDQHFYNENKIADFQATGIGIGLGQSKEALQLLEFVLQLDNKPLVLDADAINLLATNNHLLQYLPHYSILTPHPGELKRLLGAWNNDFEKIIKAQEFCHKYNCYLIIKGHYSLIVSPEDKLVFNITGNAGMATAGSGDVLTGIITSLLAQGYHPYEAALAGVYIHGAAGDIAAITLSQTAMVAGDIIDSLPNFFLRNKL